MAYLYHLIAAQMILDVVVERCFQYSKTKTFAKSRFRPRIPPLSSPLSIINTEYWTAVKLDLAEIENILFSIKHLLYKYKLIFSFYRRFLTFSENSKKVSTLFVILKIFVKFPVSLYLTGWYWKYHPKTPTWTKLHDILNIFPTEKV